MPVRVKLPGEQATTVNAGADAAQALVAAIHDFYPTAAFPYYNYVASGHDGFSHSFDIVHSTGTTGAVSNSHVTAGSGVDAIIDDGGGRDVLQGSEQTRIFKGNDAGDVFSVRASALVIGGQGNDTVAALTGTRVETYLGAGDNQVNIASGRVDLLGPGLGHDTVVAVDGGNVVTATHAVTVELGGKDAAAPDVLRLGDHSRVIVRGGASTTVVRGDHQTVRLAGPGHKLVLGQSIGDQIFGVDGGARIDALSANHATIDLSGGGYDVSVMGADIHAAGGSTFHGGGNDAYRLGAGPLTTIAEAGAATVSGGAGDLVFRSAAGKHVFSLHAGNSVIHESAHAAATIKGGSGTLRFSADGGQDSIVAGAGATTVTVGGDRAGTLVFRGGDGSALVSLGKDAATMVGGVGNETVQAGSGNLIARGGAGAASLTLGAGDTTVVAGSGATAIKAGSGSLLFVGGQGDAAFSLGAGSAAIHAAGATTLHGGTGSFSFHGGTGDDSILAGTGAALVRAGAGALVFRSGGGDDLVVAGSGGATMVGGSGKDYFVGGSGRNVFHVGSGQETFLGGAGVDLMDAAGATSLDLRFDSATGGGNHVIRDFTHGADHLSLVGYDTLWTFDHAKVVHGNTILSLDDGTRITLLGFTHLQQSDFG